MEHTGAPQDQATVIENIVTEALSGRAGLLLLLAHDSADAAAALDAFVWASPQMRGLPKAAYTSVCALPWETPNAGALLRRLGLDVRSETLGLEGGDKRVMVITEAQWADAESLQKLSSAIHRLAEVPVLLIMAGATVGEGAVVLQQLASVHRATTVNLEGLDGAGVRALAARLGVALDEATARRVAKHTEGSAAAVRELLVDHDPELWRAPDFALPAGITARRQLADLLRLRPKMAQVVGACAVIGRWASLEDLSAMTGLDDLPRIVDEAVGLGILRVRRAGMQSLIGFASRLYRAAAYELLGLQRQTELHTLASEVLSDEDARLRQRVLALGRPDEELARAVEERAGDDAAQGLWARAGESWLLASRLSADPASRAHRLLQAADAIISHGDLLEVEAILPELETEGPSPARDAVLGYHQLLLGHRDEAELLLHRAWEQADNDGLRSGIAHRLALHNLVDWNAPKLVEWGQRAIDLADGAVPSIPSGLEAHTMLGLGLGGCGRADEALKAYARVTSVARSGAQGQRALMGQGWLHLALDSVPLAASELDVSSVGASDRGSTRISLWACGWLAHARLALGDLTGAQTAVDRAVPLLQQTGQRVALPLVHWAGAHLAALRGDLATAENHAAMAASVRADYQGMRVAAAMARASVAISVGDYPGTLRALRSLINQERHQGIDEPGFWSWQDLYAIALVATGESARADEFLQPHEALAVERGHRSTMARLGAVRARIHFSRGQVVEGRERYEKALADISEMPLALLQARIHMAYGQSLRRAGKRRDARVELEQAASGFEAMGAHGYVQRCQRELNAGGRVRPADSTTELTPQEQAVVELVCQGMTNREVASSLFISVKTVQYHLTRVYARLGIRSRAELVGLQLPSGRS